MHHHRGNPGYAVAHFIFDFVRNSMSLADGEVATHHHVEIDVIPEADLADKALLQSQDRGNGFRDRTHALFSHPARARYPRSSAKGFLTWRHPPKMMTGAAHNAAQSSALGLRVHTATEMPMNAKVEVMASLKWCQASPLSAVLSILRLTPET